MTPLHLVLGVPHRFRGGHLFLRLTNCASYLHNMQILARLGHPSKTANEQVQNLINSIGKDCPHLVVYPAVVGSLSGNSSSESSHILGIIATLWPIIHIPLKVFFQI